MKNYETKCIVSGLLKSIPDKGVEEVLRHIIFDDETKINWDIANDYITFYTPEVKVNK